MGNTQDYNVVWQLDRANCVYLAGERVTGHAYISNKYVISLRKTLYLTYVVRLSQEKSSQQKDAAMKSLRHCLYSMSKPVLAVTQNDSAGSDLDAHTIKVAVDLELSELAPPTIHSNNGAPLVMHSLSISQDGRLEKVMEGSRSITICVLPKVDLLHFPTDPCEYRSPGNKNTFVHLQISTGSMLPGDTLFIDYSIFNPKAYECTQFSMQLVQIYNVEDLKGEREVTSTKPTDVCGRDDFNIRGRTSLHMPFGPFAPTCTYVGGSNKQYHIRVQYAVRCILKISSFVHGDIKFQVPLIIGSFNSHNDNIPFHELNKYNQRSQAEASTLGFGKLLDETTLFPIAESLRHQRDGGSGGLGWTSDNRPYANDNQFAYGFDEVTSRTAASSSGQEGCNCASGMGDPPQGQANSTGVGKKFSQEVMKMLRRDQQPNDSTFQSYTNCQSAQDRMRSCENEYTSIYSIVDDCGDLHEETTEDGRKSDEEGY